MSCYMCDKEATGVEHVPPKCLFPESKDLPPGIDQRQQLITVTACDEHNNAKSKDDEYLLCLLVITLPANETAKTQFSTKMMRSIKRNPSLIKKLMASQHPVIAVGNQTGKAHNTFAITVDDARIDTLLDQLSRALYFHHFEEKWLGDVKTYPEFLVASLDPESHDAIARWSVLADHLFTKCEYHGANPDVFKYQVLEGGEIAHKLMRLHFYSGCRVSVFFENTT